MTQQHRHQLAYPALWRAVDGAIRDAMTAHDDIQIPDRRRASIVKRAVGSMLALQGVGAGKPAATGVGEAPTPAPTGAHVRGVEGLADLAGQPQRRRWRKARKMFPWPSLDQAGRRSLRTFIAAERTRFVAFHRGHGGLIFVELRQ